MKIFFSGEIDSDVYDSWRDIREYVFEKLNAHISDKSYGEAILNIGIIPIISGPRFIDGAKERRLVQRKSKSADYRLLIDFDSWLNGSDEERKLLLINNVLDAIKDIDRKMKGDFDCAALRNDILECFNIEQ